MPKVTITITPIASHSTVFVDDVDISNAVQRVVIDCDAKRSGITSVMLELGPQHVDVIAPEAFHQWEAHIVPPPNAEREPHKCYKCGAMTTLGTAWRQRCLDEAEEHRKHYPPRPKPRLTPPMR